MTSPAELDTPAVTVDLDIMAANIRRVQAHLDRHGLRNRPHVKTHKIPAIGRMQIEGGAGGMEVWVELQAGRVAAVTADVGLSGVRTIGVWMCDNA
jgi:D-serine deaminase-like pyridoxal phosphate-dependent protein